MRGVVHWTGRVMITLGLLIFLFVGFQLWGTNVLQAREQRALKSDFRERLEQRADARAATTTTEGSGGRPGQGAADDPPIAVGPPERGEVVAIIQIPAIGVEQAVIEGVGHADLRKGPGRYPQTALLGSEGNAAIAGHRTTYGAPFGDLDDLEPGDEIMVATLEGEFRYEVAESYAVQPTNLDPIQPAETGRLTLTTCHPRFSSRQRLIVVADVVRSVSDPPPSPPTRSRVEREPVASVETLDGDDGSGLRGIDAALVLSGLAVAGVGGAWWWAFRRRPGAATWLVGFAALFPVLFVFFAQVERVLPSNY